MTVGRKVGNRRNFNKKNKMGMKNKNKNKSKSKKTRSRTRPRTRTRKRTKRRTRRIRRRGRRRITKLVHERHVTTIYKGKKARKNKQMKRESKQRI